MSDTKVKMDLWQRQAAALACILYRVTLMKDGNGWNWSNRETKDGDPERFFTVDDVAASIKAMRGHNASGWNVFITPIDTTWHYFVIDDVPTPEAVAAIKTAGYRPCLVQSSSAGSIQMILRVPKLPNKKEQQMANKLVVELNRKYGDQNFQGVIHPFRLVGFSNKKPNRKGEFTKLIETDLGAVCSKTSENLGEFRRAGEVSCNSVDAKPSPAQHERLQTNPACLGASANEEYRRLRGGYEGACRSVVGWRQDNSLIDFKCAKEMAGQGFCATEIAVAIVAESPNLAERHPNYERYAAGVAGNAFRF